MKAIDIILRIVGLIIVLSLISPTNNDEDDMVLLSFGRNNYQSYLVNLSVTTIVSSLVDINKQDRDIFQ
jgi:hypothetical protein